MVNYIIRRVGYMILTLIAISFVAFFIIQLPPGDFVDSMAAGLRAQGDEVDQSRLDALRENYGLGQPLHVQYWKWISGVVVGDFGLSFQWNRPVSELLWDRLALTVILSATTIVFVWIVAFPVGVYSALNHYSFGDYFFTFLGFLGRAIPNFMLALFIMYFAFELFGVSTWGLFSQEYADAPWSLAKFLDLLQHLVVPVIVLGTAGTAGTIRVMRANLLDELSKQYVITARAKGLSRLKVVWKYPIRIALNPFISTVGWILPQLISGAAIVSVVLNLPTTGPLFLNALRTQDMYLAGSFLMMLSTLTVIGTLISDLLLAWVDPRIRYR